MGRKSSLTEKQWEEIGKKLLEDVPIRALAREHGISEAAIRKRFGARTKQIKDVANQLVAAETAFKSLPISAQIGARTLADRLLSISNHLASAAEYGAATAHRLSAIAHSKTIEVDEGSPLTDESLKSLKGIAVLTDMANKASEIGIGILKANKDPIGDDEPPTPVAIEFGVKDARKHGDHPA